MRYRDGAGSRPSATVERRFWGKVDKTERGCWNWTGSTLDFGYGELWLGKDDGPHGLRHVKALAHRISYELHFGDIPEGMRVLHRCDNPRCVRPDHLFLGTHADNMDDMVRKNRQQRRSTPGEANNYARLTDAAVREIRALHGTATQTEIARRFGVSVAQVNRIVLGKAWTHIDKEPTSSPQAEYTSKVAPEVRQRAMDLLTGGKVAVR